MNKIPVRTEEKAEAKKRCKACGQWKRAQEPDAAFYPRQATCKECYNLRQRANYHKKNPEAKVYKEEDPSSQAISAIKDDPTAARSLIERAISIRQELVERDWIIGCIDSYETQYSVRAISEDQARARVAANQGTQLRRILVSTSEPDKWACKLSTEV